MPITLVTHSRRRQLIELVASLQYGRTSLPFSIPFEDLRPRTPIAEGAKDSDTRIPDADGTL